MAFRLRVAWEFPLAIDRRPRQETEEDTTHCAAHRHFAPNQDRSRTTNQMMPPRMETLTGQETLRNGDSWSGNGPRNLVLCGE